MPIYEYECQKCKAHTEILQKITDKPLKKCSRCGGRLEKQWSQTGFQFKGTGWYVTDYAGQKSSDAAAAEEKKNAPASAPDAAAEKSATTTTSASAEKTPGKEKPATKKTDTSSKIVSSNNTGGD